MEGRAPHIHVMEGPHIHVMEGPHIHVMEGPHIHVMEGPHIQGRAPYMCDRGPSNLTVMAHMVSVLMASVRVLRTGDTAQRNSTNTMAETPYSDKVAAEKIYNGDLSPW